MILFCVAKVWVTVARLALDAEDRCELQAGSTGSKYVEREVSSSEVKSSQALAASREGIRRVWLSI
jgi:hypothetical protein